MKRYAVISGRGTAEAVARYLPAEYKLFSSVEANGTVVAMIEGEDAAGWTLDGYVLPRLESGLYWGREFPKSRPRLLRRLDGERTGAGIARVASVNPRRNTMTNDEIIQAVQDYCADIHAAKVERDERLGKVDGPAWTGADAEHIAALLNESDKPMWLFRFMDEQTGDWRVGYRTRDGREWFHILRQMRNTRGSGLLENIGMGS